MGGCVFFGGLDLSSYLPAPVRLPPTDGVFCGLLPVVSGRKKNQRPTVAETTVHLFRKQAGHNALNRPANGKGNYETKTVRWPCSAFQIEKKTTSRDWAGTSRSNKNWQVVGMWWIDDKPLSIYWNHLYLRVICEWLSLWTKDWHRWTPSSSFRVTTNPSHLKRNLTHRNWIFECSRALSRLKVTLLKGTTSTKLS